MELWKVVESGWWREDAEDEGGKSLSLDVGEGVRRSEGRWA